ncbi:MAG: MGDG synthase family glycosyltransferase [Brevefilum sp.]
MPERKGKILILTGDAGLGHRIAAEALEQAFKNQFGSRCEVTITNPLNHPDIPDFIRESQSDYDEFVKNFPELYKLGYEVSDSKLPVNLMEDGSTLLLLDVMRDIHAETDPDLVITTYPIYQAPLCALRDSDDLSIPFMATVTDLVTVHKVWFNTDITRLTVPTEAVRQRALEAGLTPEQIIITGIPVDPEIQELKSVSKPTIREELGWKPEITTLLVVGSPRVVSLMDILQKLDESDQVFQFALVAGGNDPLHEKFETTEWKHPNYVYNFIEFMPKLMRASDMIVCKAGGLIVTESLASGLPLMLVHVLPGQEQGNVAFVIDHNAGALCETPEEAYETFSGWLGDGRARLEEIAQNAEDAGRADAARKITEIAWDLIE